jgi:hypothetical protein
MSGSTSAAASVSKPDVNDSLLTTMPLEEKVVVLEEQAHQKHTDQFGAKVVGAALSSMCILSSYGDRECGG